MRLILTLLLLPLLAYGSAIAYLWYEVKSNTDDAIKAAAPFAEIRYDSVHTSLLGDEVGLNNILIKPVMSQDEFRIEQIRISGPHPGYFIIAGNSLKKGEPPESLGMRIHRMQLDINSEIFTMLEQMQLQAEAAMAQASNPQTFDFNLGALGCGDLTTFTLGDYRRMGIGNTVSDITINVTHDKTNNRMQVNANANTEGLYNIKSSFDFELGSKGVITPTVNTNGIPKMSLNYQDKGYYRLRNTYCAGLNNSSIASYINNHTQSVSKKFGIKFREKTVTAYKRLMQNGGDVTIQTNPSGTIPFSDLKNATAADIIQFLGLNIAINGTRLDIGAAATENTAGNTVTGNSNQVEAPHNRPRQQPRPTSKPTTTTTTTTTTTPQHVTEPAYKTVRVSNAGKYIGKIVEITMSEGKVRSGMLEKVNENRLYLVMQLSGGTLTYPVETRHINEIRVHN